MEEKKEGTLHGVVRQRWFEMYEKRNGVMYPWVYRKEDGMLKEFLQYLKWNFKNDDDQGLELKAVEIFKIYFLEPDEKKQMYPFATLHKYRAKYVSKLVPQKPVERVVVKQAEREPMELNLGQFTSWATENPRQAIRGFAWTGALLKKMNPEKYAKIRSYLVDLVGPERARKMVEDANRERLEVFGV